MQITKKNIDYAKSNFTKLQQKLRNKDSRAEDTFARLLSLAGIYYFREKCNFRVGTRWCYYDFLIPGYNILVEIDGEEHSAPEQLAIDEEKEILVKNKEFRVVRFTNREVLNMDSIELLDIVHRLKSKEKRIPLKNFGQWARTRHQQYYQLKQLRRNLYGDGILTGIVFLYNRETNCFYRFESAFDLHFSTNIPMQSILSDLGKSQYSRTKSRKYIISYSQGDCIKWSAFMWEDEQIMAHSVVNEFIEMAPAVKFLRELMTSEKLKAHTRKRRKL